MLADPITVVAQLINFLILVALLKHFLYGPILAAVAGRERRIAGELADAARAQAAAAAQEADWRARVEGFEAAHEAQWHKAQAEIAARRQALLAAAEAAISRREADRRGAQQAERAAEAEALAGQAREEAIAIARRVLADLSGAGLEAAMAAAMLERWRSLPQAEQAPLRAALAAGGPVVVRSSVPLGPEAQAVLARAVAEVGGPAPAFEVDARLVGGLVLTAGAYQLDWSVAGYVEGLAERLGREVDEVAAATEVTHAGG